MSEEEKKAIEFDLKCLDGVMLNFEDRLCDEMQERISRVQNYIEKQQKEIENLKEDNKKKSIVIIEYQNLYEQEEEKNKELDKEAQGYLEELAGDGSMNVRRIQELKSELEKEKEKNKEMYIEGTNVAHNLCNKMWEDKIKAKIEEYEKEIKQEEKFTILFNANHIRQAIITEMQSLLEDKE